MDSKPVWQSKTFYFNLLVAVLPPLFHYLSGVNLISAEQEADLLAFGNLVLRYFTKQPVTLAPKA